MDQERHEDKNPEEEKLNKEEAISVERLLNEMVDLMKFAVENVDKPLAEQPKDLGDQLSKLEKKVNKLAESGPRLSPMDKQFLEPLLPPAQQNLIDECLELKKDMEIKIEALAAKEREEAAKEGKTIEKVETSEEVTERRAKSHKRMSRTQQWKHL